MIRRSTTARADEEFDVAVSARDRGGEYPYLRAALRRREGGDIVADFLMHRGVADDAALGVFAPCLELRLDQRQEMHRRCRQRQRDRQYRFQRDETDVDDYDVRSGRQALALKFA